MFIRGYFIRGDGYETKARVEAASETGMIDTPTIEALSGSRGERRAALAVAAVPLALFVLGAGSAALYFWGRDLHRFTQWIAAYIWLFVGQLAFYAVACYIVTRWPAGSSRIARWTTLAFVIFFAIAFRAVLVPQRPYLSADVYRYVWDGRVQAAGVNPYRYVPDDPSLASLRDDKIFKNISKEDQRWLSPYPPAAQAVFLMVALARPLSFIAFKAAMSSFDLITTLVLMLVLARSGIDPARAIVFAWHPLIIFESAHSGHIESAFIAFLALALLAWSSQKYALTGASLALATLVKFYPVLLLPVFLIAKRDDASRSLFEARRPGRTGYILGMFADRRNLAILAGFVVTIALAYAPYLGAGKNLFGFLNGYIEEEGFVHSGARYFALYALRKLVGIPTEAFLIFAAGCLLIGMWWSAFRLKRTAVDVARGATLVIGLFLILTTPRYTWYYAWMIPFLCFAPRMGWFYLTCAPALLYLVWYTPLVYPEIPLWIGASIYVPALAWLAWEYFKRQAKAERDASVEAASG